jgi:hypothetical protein
MEKLGLKCPLIQDDDEDEDSGNGVGGSSHL